MNQVILMGRLVKDPELKTSAQSSKEVARFTLAVNRGKDNSDYINVVAFDKTAQVVGQFLSKGKPVMVVGNIKTGSYEKEGKKVYTTDVWADRIEFVPMQKEETKKEETKPERPSGFSALNDEDIPF